MSRQATHIHRQDTLKDCIQFYVNCRGWHTFTNDKDTVEKICAGVNLGILKINEFNMCRIRSKEKALRYLKYGKGV